MEKHHARCGECHYFDPENEMCRHEYYSANGKPFSSPQAGIAYADDYACNHFNPISPKPQG